ncbi:MAG: FimV/HubP family polar landmark protein [Pseudomonas sp.]|uniref:type IV pilus assembly protein FimV n=1 Tax=Pseudomonas sp. TaxID=306 RepID=UPI002735820B|nr:FimV/HubP family polar landmark protein [Pseudomonas sp.]MDP3847688.1 FimV/HubP family polar landmark protein [Pseudomonas sp.]
MVQLRRLLLALAAASSSSVVSQVWALGLGEVQVQSALSQPLRAQIALHEVAGLNQDEVVVRLASPQAYQQAGLQRDDFLSNVQLSPQLNAQGGVIRISSSQPVREPYLTLLVEVVWPAGRQLREYSLLLDPPSYSYQAPVAPAAPASNLAANSPSVSAALPSRVSAAPALQAGGHYQTRDNDRLWDIAQDIRGGATAQQAMLAIQQLNAEAFVGGNINRLRSRQTLQLPTEQQMQQTAAAQALAQVEQQQQSWRSGAPAQRQLDARARTAAAAAPVAPVATDSLSLLGASDGKGNVDKAKGTAEQVTADQLKAELALTQEGLDLARREGEELNSRLTDLQSQLDKLQRIVTLKDNQLALLQAQLAAAEQPQTVTQQAPAPSAAALN